MKRKNQEPEVEIIVSNDESDIEYKLEKTGQKVGKSVGKAVKTSLKKVDQVQSRIKESDALKKTKAKSKDVLDKTKGSLEKTREKIIKKKPSREDE